MSKLSQEFKNNGSVEGMGAAEAASRGDALRALFDSLGQQGLDLSTIELKESAYSKGDFGVCCARDFEPEEVLLSIPLDNIITVEMGMATHLGKLLMAYEDEMQEEADLSAPKHIFLVFFLLTDRLNPSSPFQSYYRALPSTFPSIPLFWSQEDLSFLEGSYMLTLIADRRAALQADYTELCRIIPSFSEFSEADFIWARMIVASRNFGVDIDQNHTDILCPIADMLNHFRPRMTKWAYDDEEEAFKVSSLQALSAGAELLDSYGKKCNSRFLLNYGFCVADNTDPDGRCYNEVRLFFALDKTDPAFGLKKSLAGKSFYFSSDAVYSASPVVVAGGAKISKKTGGSRQFGRGARLSKHHDDSSSREALSLARFISASAILGRRHEVQLLPFLEEVNLQNPRERIPPLSTANEAEALSIIQNLCVEQLERYSSNEEIDCSEGGGKEALEGGGKEMSFNKRAAQILIAGEKDVCKFWLGLSKSVIPILTNPMRILAIRSASELSSDASTSMQLKRYLDHVVIPLLEEVEGLVGDVLPAVDKHMAALVDDV